MKSAVLCFFLFGHLLLPYQQLWLCVECRGSQEILLPLLQILVSALAIPLGEDGPETGHAWAVQHAGTALWPSNRVLNQKEKELYQSDIVWIDLEQKFEVICNNY